MEIIICGGVGVGHIEYIGMVRQLRPGIIIISHPEEFTLDATGAPGLSSVLAERFRNLSPIKEAPVTGWKELRKEKAKSPWSRRKKR